MVTNVFANGREICSKAAEGRSTCAFPDVCFTPPQTAITPLGTPTPYPNSGVASDCSNGSSTVSISGQEVMLRNVSYFKRSYGDDAGRAPKRGIASGQIGGKVYFSGWSMDVFVEGENVPRHLDITTHNHASHRGNTLYCVYCSASSAPRRNSCIETMRKISDSCKPTPLPPVTTRNPKTGRIEQKGVDCGTGECAKWRPCYLPKYKLAHRICCAPHITGDHLIEVSCFVMKHGRRGVSDSGRDKYGRKKNYFLGVPPAEILKEWGAKVTTSPLRRGAYKLAKLLDDSSMTSLERAFLRQWRKKRNKGKRKAANVAIKATANAPARQWLNYELRAPKTRIRPLSGFEKYNQWLAPTACVDLPVTGSKHNRMQDVRNQFKLQHKYRMKGVPHPKSASWIEVDSFWTYEEAAQAAVYSHHQEFRNCDPECTRLQLDHYHHSILPGDTVEEKNRTPVATVIPSKV